MTEIAVHTLKWREDQVVKRGDELPANSSILTVVEIDGEVCETAGAVRVELNSGFSETWICFGGDVTVTSHTKEEWEELGFYSPWRQAAEDSFTLNALYAQAESSSGDTEDDTRAPNGNDLSLPENS